MSLVKSYDGFETKRLRLREPQLGDAPVMFRRWTSDPQVARYVTYETHREISETEDYLERCRTFWSDPTSPHAQFILVRKVEQDAVGFMDLSHKRSCIGLGYVLARDVWGQGLMTELIDTLSSDLLGRKAIYRVDATVDVENIASARVLEKAGFQREAVLRKYGMCPTIGPEPRDLWMYARVKARSTGESVTV